MTGDEGHFSTSLPKHLRDYVRAYVEMQLPGSEDLPPENYVASVIVDWAEKGLLKILEDLPADLQAKFWKDAKPKTTSLLEFAEDQDGARDQ